MVKFILLEEDHEMQYKIKKAIRAVSIKNDKNIKILNFPVWSLELNQEIKDDTCSKIYVADLRKKENKERLKIVEKIRKIDLESDIIFIINKDFIETVHQKIVQIFDVVDQPEEMEKRLEKDFEILLEKKSNPHILYLKKEKKSFEIPMKKILYITRDKKDRQAIIYYTLNETEKTLRVNYSLKALKEKLDENFIRTHKSCVANKKRILARNYMKKYFVLDTGKKVELLSSKYKEEIESPSKEKSFEA